MKRTFKELVQQIEALQENQQGKLAGGFSILSVQIDISLYQTDNCTNNCSCTNQITNCSSNTLNTSCQQ